MTDLLLPFSQMASSILSTLNPHTSLKYPYIGTKPLLHPRNLHFNPIPKASNISLIKPPKCLSSSNFPPFDEDGGYIIKRIIASLKQWFDLVCSIFPGGSWWNFSSYNIVGSGNFPALAKDVSVVQALGRIWSLIEEDKWVVCVAFASLTIAALSEISIPSVLTMSIFSAQRVETISFYRNARFLAILCVSSGICSGLRSGCFATVNMILVRRLQKTLYDVLLHQDIYFFDTEAVGNLTSRFGTDC